MEGFTKPLKTARPRVVDMCVSLNCETKFFPANSGKPKEQVEQVSETKKKITEFRKFPKRNTAFQKTKEKKKKKKKRV